MVSDGDTLPPRRLPLLPCFAMSDDFMLIFAPPLPPDGRLMLMLIISMLPPGFQRHALLMPLPPLRGTEYRQYLLRAYVMRERYAMP